LKDEILEKRLKREGRGRDNTALETWKKRRSCTKREIRKHLEK
jgi:hypothetical protein